MPAPLTPIGVVKKTFDPSAEIVPLVYVTVDAPCPAAAQVLVGSHMATLPSGRISTKSRVLPLTHSYSLGSRRCRWHLR